VRLEPLEPGQEHPATPTLLLLNLVRVVKLFLQDLADLEKGQFLNHLTVGVKFMIML
jgi:hypothetical protein